MDFLKALAILAVVVIHTSPLAGVSAGGYDLTPLNDVFNTLARFAVPIFFAISGFLLMQSLLKVDKDKQKKKYRKFIKKNAKILGIWLSVFYVFTAIMKSVVAYLTGKSVVVTIKTYLSETISLEHVWLYMHKGVLRFDAAYQLWFSVALIVAALIFYVFFRMNKVGLLLGIAFALHLIGLTGQSYKEIIEFPFDWRTRDAIFFGLFYFTLGAWFAKGNKLLNKLESQLSNSTLLIIVCLWAIVTVFERLYFTHSFGLNYAADYYIGNIFETFFLMLWAIKNVHAFSASKIKVFGENSHYIFLTHTLFIYLLSFVLEAKGIALSDYLIGSLLYVPFVFVVSYYFYKGIDMAKGKLSSIKK